MMSIITNLTILFDITRILSRQGLAFRVDESEENGNFNQIVLLLSKHVAVLKKWLDDKAFRKHSVTYMSHDSQNEFIDLLSDEVKKKSYSRSKRNRYIFGDGRYRTCYFTSRSAISLC